jgi:hypothetical protein
MTDVFYLDDELRTDTRLYQLLTRADGMLAIFREVDLSDDRMLTNKRFTGETSPADARRAFDDVVIGVVHA